MLVCDVLEELDYLPQDMVIQVEINGVVHDIHAVRDDSQGVYLVVDTDIEDKEMR